ncbi:MAG: twin-arginine translocase TatA/TatE family subunit [Chitinophagaceae bacterium]
MSFLPSQFLLIEMPGGGELLIILVVVLLLFGGKKIPELMRGLGKGIREFNDAKSNVTKELEEGMKETPANTQNSTKVNTTPNPSNNSNVTSSSNAVTSHD